VRLFFQHREHRGHRVSLTSSQRRQEGPMALHRVAPHFILGGSPLCRPLGRSDILSNHSVHHAGPRERNGKLQVCNIGVVLQNFVWVITDPTPNPSPTKDGNGCRLVRRRNSEGPPLPCRRGAGGGVSNPKNGSTHTESRRTHSVYTKNSVPSVASVLKNKQASIFSTTARKFSFELPAN
jgi:hypothetical protein